MNLIQIEKKYFIYNFNVKFSKIKKKSSENPCYKCVNTNITQMKNTYVWILKMYVHDTSKYNNNNTNNNRTNIVPL